MELKSKNFYFFLYFLLFSLFVTLTLSTKKISPTKLHSRKTLKIKLKRNINPFNSTKYSSFVIQAPKGKKTATINFNLRNSHKMVSLGIVNQHFHIFSHNFTHFQHKSEKSSIRGRNILTNQLKSTGEISYKKVSQWRLVHQDTWNKNLTTNGWNFDLVSTCRKALFFGGKCLLAKKELTKTYLNLPKHSQVRIEAYYHHIGKWNSNSGYLKLLETNIGPNKKERYVWTGLCKNKEGSRLANLCGYETCRINVPISVTVPHKKRHLAIAFGADLGHDHSCEASYAISDIKIYVR